VSSERSFVANDGTVIGYRQLGSGPGLVLLHGALQSAASFTDLGAALADRFTWCMAAPIHDGHGAINRTLCFVLPVDTPEARRTELLALLRERARGLSLAGS